MPTEAVNPSTRFGIAPYRAAVAWEDPAPITAERTEDRHVYVGSLTAAPRSLFAQLTADRVIKREIASRTRALATHLASGPIADDELYRAVINILEMSLRAAEDPDTESFPDAQGHPEPEGIWTSLDRTGVNRMIKLLRRARDAAFGADA